MMMTTAYVSSHSIVNVLLCWLANHVLSESPSLHRLRLELCILTSFVSSMRMLVPWAALCCSLFCFRFFFFVARIRRRCGWRDWAIGYIIRNNSNLLNGAHTQACAWAGWWCCACWAITPLTQRVLCHFCGLFCYIFIPPPPWPGTIPRRYEVCFILLVLIVKPSPPLFSSLPLSSTFFLCAWVMFAIVFVFLWCSSLLLRIRTTK